MFTTASFCNTSLFVGKQGISDESLAVSFGFAIPYIKVSETLNQG